MKKVFDLETHCRDECMIFIVNRYPGVMNRLKNRFNDLPLDLTLQAAFTHIFDNVTDVIDTREEYVKTHAALLSLTFQASEEDGLSNYLDQVTKLLRRLEVLNCGKEYKSEMIVAQCQSVIRRLGISKQELQSIDKDWSVEDRYKPDETRFERLKQYYIAETAILAADEVQATNNHANSVLQQKVNDLGNSLIKLQNDNSVLMANQEEMASEFKNSGVPTKITTGFESIAPGMDLAAYISRLVDKRTQASSSNKRTSRGTSGGDENQKGDPRKLNPKVTWWRQFKHYCPSCGVNLNHGAKDCPKMKRTKSHDKKVT